MALWRGYQPAKPPQSEFEVHVISELGQGNDRCHGGQRDDRRPEK